MPAAPDTTPPSAPSALTATAVERDPGRTWAGPPSTDNVGVTGYRVERCQGAGCTNFAEVGTPTGTAFNDTGLAASTHLSLPRARRRRGRQPQRLLGDRLGDHAGAADTTRAVGAHRRWRRRRSAPTQVDLSWTASTDNVGRHRLPGRALPGRGLHDFAAGRDADRDHVQRHRPDARARPTATGCGRSTPPATSSAYSAIVTATTPGAPDTTAPSAPTGLTATASSTTQSTWAGPPRPTTSASPAIGSSAAWAQAARLRADRDADRHDVQRHRPDGDDHVPLPGARGRRCRQPQRLLGDRHASTLPRPTPRRRRRPRDLSATLFSTKILGHEEVEMVVRSVAPLSAAKVLGTLYALIGFIVGAMIALAALVGGFAADQDAGLMGSLMGVGAIVAFPLLYGCFGFVFTLVLVALQRRRRNGRRDRTRHRVARPPGRRRAAFGLRLSARQSTVDRRQRGRHPSTRCARSGQAAYGL